MSYTNSNPIVEPCVCHQCGAIQTGNAKASPLGRPLSPRQLEVASLAVQGKPNYFIAFKLAITEQTVKNHMHAIFTKLGVRKREEVASRMPEQAALEMIAAARLE